MGQKYAFIKPDAALYASEFKFAKHGDCGAELSEALPHLAEVADDIAIVKSMTTDAFNHAPGTDPDANRLDAVWPALYRLHGRFTGWAAKRRICRGLLC